MASDSVTPPAPAPTIPVEIAKALIAIQKDLRPMIKTAENESFGNAYVPLEDVTERAHELLSAHEIGLSQPTTTDMQGHAALETILFTASGETFSRTTKLALAKVDPQAHGSAITYTRRYALMATLGLTGKGDDDDGNKATGVFAPVTEEQLDRLKSLLKYLRWPKNTIAAEVFKIKTRDHAYLAIKQYEEIVAQKVRDEESKDNAAEVEFGKKITVKDQTPEPEKAEADDELAKLSAGSLQKRIKALGLRDTAAENKFVHRVTGKPFLKALKRTDDFVSLERGLTLIETGMHALPAEFYPTADEPRVVEEDVA